MLESSKKNGKCTRTNKITKTPLIMMILVVAVVVTIIVLMILLILMTEIIILPLTMRIIFTHKNY